MSTEQYIRIIAGTIVLIGLVLGRCINEWWYLLSVLPAVNLIQSAFTGFCPAEIILKKLGVKTEAELAREKSSSFAER
jgi:hypothetical protein